MFFFKPIYIPRALNTGTCIQQGDLFYSVGLHRNHVLATANTGKNRERFRKKCRWIDRKCRNKQERKKSLAVSVACMAIYWPTPGFKGRTFKLCVLTRWDFNFCVRSSPLRGNRIRIRRVAGRIYGMKYRWKGHKREKDTRTEWKEWASSVDLCQGHKP